MVGAPQEGDMEGHVHEPIYPGSLVELLSRTRTVCHGFESHPCSFLTALHVNCVVCHVHM